MEGDRGPQNKDFKYLGYGCQFGNDRPLLCIRCPDLGNCPGKQIIDNEYDYTLNSLEGTY